MSRLRTKPSPSARPSDVLPSSALVLTLAASSPEWGNPSLSRLPRADSSGSPPILRAGNIPKAASFDPTSGRFSWTPDASQAGQFDLVFTATNSAAASATPHVLIEVGSGRPLINDIRNAQPGTSGLSAWISACAAREKSTRTGRVSFFAREPPGQPRLTRRVFRPSLD